MQARLVALVVVLLLVVVALLLLAHPTSLEWQASVGGSPIEYWLPPGSATDVNACERDVPQARRRRAPPLLRGRGVVVGVVNLPLVPAPWTPCSSVSAV